MKEVGSLPVKEWRRPALTGGSPLWGKTRLFGPMDATQIILRKRGASQQVTRTTAMQGGSRAMTMCLEEPGPAPGSLMRLRS